MVPPPPQLVPQNKWPDVHIYELPGGKWIQCEKMKQETCGFRLTRCMDNLERHLTVCVPHVKDMGIVDFD